MFLQSLPLLREQLNEALSPSCASNETNAELCPSDFGAFPLYRLSFFCSACVHFTCMLLALFSLPLLQILASFGLWMNALKIAGKIICE